MSEHHEYPTKKSLPNRPPFLENYPRVQILTIDELMKDPHRPNPAILQVPGGAAAQHTLQQPQQHKGRGAKQGGLFGSGAADNATSATESD